MKTRLAPLLSTLALAMLPASVRAATFHVAKNGNDGFVGSATLPFLTVGKGVSALRAPGDILYIHSGTYSGFANAINPQVSGTTAAPITIAAFPGDLPIIDGTGITGGGSGVEPSTTAVQYVRFVGLVSRNWPSSGFSNGFNTPSGHIEFRNCIADNNGINGIAFYKSSGVLIENCVVAHNGNQLPSWSSGVNLFTVSGTFQDNVVRGNVSFENVDISANHSDGSGFILDEGSTGALFDGNLAFGNGGSCIRLTNSSGSHMVNNTCFHNGVDPANLFVVHEIFFSDAPSRTNVLVANNLAAAIAGRMGVSQTSGTGLTFRNNLWINNNGATPFFTNPAGVDFRILANAPTVIDQGNAADASISDIGFDPRCIRAQTGQAVGRWQYAVDYNYVASVGGVTGCFHPAARRQGAAPDLGAYELGSGPGTGGSGGSGGSGPGGTGGGGGSPGTGGAPGSGGRGGTGTGVAGSTGSSGTGGQGGGATGSGVAGASGGVDPAGGGGAGGTPGGGGSETPGNADGGCGCRTGDRPCRAIWDSLAGAIALLLIAVRRRRGRWVRSSGRGG